MSAIEKLSNHIVDQPTRELDRRIVEESLAMREALLKIATGDGHYGMQAREYKNIARQVLGMPLL